VYSDKIKIKHAGGGVGNSGAKNGGAGGGVEYTSPKTKGSKGKKLRFPVRPDFLFVMTACRSQALNTPVT